jgi:hypothetical protein
MIDVKSDGSLERSSAYSFSLQKISALIDRLYQLVFKMEDAQFRIETPEEPKERYLKEILLELNIESDYFVLVQLVKLKKGIKLLQRILQIVCMEYKVQIFMKIIECLEYLEVVSKECDTERVDLFVDRICLAFVAVVSSASLEEALNCLQILSKKSTLHAILVSKVGVVVFCLLMSRIEILKDEGTDSIQLDGVMEAVFTALQEEFTSLFTIPNAESYSWQFLALLSMNATLSQKRILIIELRNKILSTAKSQNQGKISEMSVFLNALGIDVSQLK